MEKSIVGGGFGRSAGPRGVLSGLLFFEVLTGNEHFDAVVEYFARYSICLWAVHESGRKVWLRARSTDSINIVVARATSESELRRVQLSGSSVVDIGLLVDGLEFVLARARAASESGDSLHEPRQDAGELVWATIRSPVPGFVHTLVERSSYEDAMMPGWRPLRAEEKMALEGSWGDEIAGLSAVDHITVACARGRTKAVSMWYQSVFGLRDDTGATVLQFGSGGLRLSALWSRQRHELAYVSPLILTLVESLGHAEAGKRDQVIDFLAEHAGSGVQHVAFFAPDILATERLLRERAVEFISAPPAYYRGRRKVQQIEAAGLSVEELRAGQILFDGHVGRRHEEPGYLLQVFTPPPFERKTVFFELIYRGCDAEGEEVEGFGAGNIRDLFRAVAESEAPQVQPVQVVRASNSCHAPARAEQRTEELYRMMQAECADIFASNRGLGKGPAAEREHSVIIIGAGLCGLTAALALVESGVRVTLVESRTALPQGTRAVTWVRSSLEFFASLGVISGLLCHSVPWARGVIRRGRSSAFDWRSQVSEGEYPAYSNIPQFVVHAELLKKLARSDRCTFMFDTTVTGLAGSLQPGGMVVHALGPSGDPLAMVGKYVIDSSGANSKWRSHLSTGIEVSREGVFLITDMHADGEQALPDERIFWFDAPFHEDGQTFLMLPQQNGVLRMDFGLEGGRREDSSALRTAEERAQRALSWLARDPRYAALGLDSADFRLGWSSLYRYSSGSIDTAVEGRLVWVGDSLKRVSPFGARGGNGGIRDVAALSWRLALILREGADSSLLEDYSEERIYSAECDVLINRATMRFIRPPPTMRFLREAVLEAYEQSCKNQSIGQFINTGRFPTPPPSLRGLSAFTDPRAQNGVWSEQCPEPGDYFRDGALADGGSLFSLLPRQKFVLLVFGAEVAIDLKEMPWLQLICVRLDGCESPRASAALACAYDARPGTCVLLRPDLVVLARWRHFDASCRDFCSQIAIPSRPSERSSKVSLDVLCPHDAVFWLLYGALDALASEAAKLRLLRGLCEHYTVDTPSCTSLASVTPELFKVLARRLAAEDPRVVVQNLRVVLARLSAG